VEIISSNASATLIYQLINFQKKLHMLQHALNRCEVWELLMSTTYFNVVLKPKHACVGIALVLGEHH
jgi:hypothetical protein